MEVLNNFISIYCFITFIFGAMFMFTTLCIAAMCKMQEPKNNVHFYVARDKGGELYLYMDKPVRESNEFLASHHGRLIKAEEDFSKFGLNVHDYANLRWEDEPVEVFLNLED